MMLFRVEAHIVSDRDDDPTTVWQAAVVVEAGCREHVEAEVIRYLESNVSQWDTHIKPRLVIDVISEVHREELAL